MGRKTRVTIIIIICKKVFLKEENESHHNKGFLLNRYWIAECQPTSTASRVSQQPDDAKGGQKYLWQIDYKSNVHNQ